MVPYVSKYSGAASSREDLLGEHEVRITQGKMAVMVKRVDEYIRGSFLIQSD